MIHLGTLQPTSRTSPTTVLAEALSMAMIGDEQFAIFGAQERQRYVCVMSRERA